MIYATYSTYEHALVDSSLNTLSTYALPKINYKDNVTLRLTVVDADGDPVSLAGYASFAFAIDIDFSSDTEPMCRTLDASMTKTSVASGIISIPIDCDTSTFLAATDGKTTWQTVKAELQCFFANGNKGETFQFDIQARGLVDSLGGDPPDPVGNYYTKAEIVALNSLKLNSDLSGLTTKGHVDDADSTFINDADAAGAPKKTLFSTIKTYMGLTFEPIISKLTAFNKNYSTTTADIMMNGTQSLGDNDTLPRSNHVHPTDTSREASGTAASAVSTHAGKTDGTAHSISGVSGLQTALDSKDASGAASAVQSNLTTHANLTGANAHGLGTMSTQAANNVAITGGGVTGITDLAVADGGTGASTAADARANLGTPALNGFENRTDSSLSMSGSNFQITTASSWNIWTNGTKYPFTTAQSVAISNDLALHYVYFNTSGVLTVSTSAWDIESDNVPVATVYKDGATYAIQDERHNYKRNRQWHKWAHDTIGTRYESGLTGTFGNSSLSIAQGEIHDEDINYDTLATKTACRLWYRNTGAATLRFVENVSTPYKSNSGTIQYDASGTLTNVDSNKYVCNYVYAAVMSDYPIQVVVGQAQHTTLASAQSESLPSIPMATVEWKLLYKVIYKNASGTATYIEAADFRTVSTGPAVAAVANSHSSLINRDAADSHPATAISVTQTNVLLGRSTAGNGAVEEITCTSAGRALMDDTDAATQRSTLGLGTAATGTTGTASGNIPTRPADNYLSANNISEITSGNGVDIDGVVLKDSGISLPSVGVNSHISITRANSAENGILKLCTAATSDWIFGLRNTSNSNFQIYSYGTSSNVFVIERTTGAVVIGTDPTGSEKLRVGGGIDSNSDKIRVRTSKTPASAGATGNAGEICWDSSYIYVCVDTNSWKRVAIAAW